MDIDFLGIQAFLAVVEQGSFQHAASHLNLSQTAISHRMRKLEESLGVRLITRTAREITLTDVGRAFLPRARNAVQQLAQSVEAVRKHGQAANDWLVFACLPTIALGILNPLLSACRAQFAETPVRVFDSAIREITELVESGTAAFGLTVMQPPRPALRMEAIAAERFVLVCPPTHRLAHRKHIRWSDLQGEPLIRISLPAGNSATIDDTLGPLRDGLLWRYEAQRNAMALEMVRGQLGLTVVPALSVVNDTSICSVPILQPQVERALVVVMRRDRVLSPIESSVRAHAVRIIRQRLGHGADDA
ncbi:MAG: LysR family transcriptional regulator [Burkholderiaceae bacterium]